MKPMIVRIIFLFMLCVLINVPAYATLNLKSHRATYEFDLTHVEQKSQIADVRGEMVFEWIDDCDGWSNVQDYSMTYFYKEGQPVYTKSDLTTWEAKDQSLYRFFVNRSTNGHVTQMIRGKAYKDDKGMTHFDYDNPKKIEFDKRANILFPSKHTFELLDRIDKGDKVFLADFFDGGDVDGPVTLNAVYLGQENAPNFENSEIDKDLVKAQGKHFRFSFFPIKETADAITPDYEMDLLLHENGVVSKMKMDYNEFTLKAKLIALKSLSDTDMVCE